MTKPIPDKAEVALEYPDKLYIGTFERTSRFDGHLDAALYQALNPRRSDKDDIAQMTPEEEVLLLHVME